MSAIPASPRGRRRILVAIHGILTGQTNPAWIDRLAHELWRQDARVSVLKRHYLAGPFPAWNVFVKNRFLAHSLANELQAYCEDGAELAFVCHSNGADIAVKTIRALGRRGFTTSAAVFIGAAISADVRRSGVRDLLSAGTLGRAYAYCAADDAALRYRVVWPYGHLGRLGFQRAGEPWPDPTRERRALMLGFPADTALLDRAFTRWFTGGHSTYFSAANEGAVFGLIASDLYAPRP